MITKQSFKQKKRWFIKSDEQGGLLAFALILSLVFSIASMSVIFQAMAEVRHGRLQLLRPQARHLAEQYIVQAQEKLWQTGGVYSSEGILSFLAGNRFDTIVTVTNPCGALVPNCGNRQVVTVRVTY